MGSRKIYEANTDQNKKNNNLLTSLSDDLTNLETSVVQTFSDSQLIDFGLYSDKPVVLSTVYITEESINKQIDENKVLEKLNEQFVNNFNTANEYLKSIGEEKLDEKLKNFGEYEQEIGKVIRLKKQIYLAVQNFYNGVSNVLPTASTDSNTQKIANVVNDTFDNSSILNDAYYEDSNFIPITNTDTGIDNSSLKNFIEPVFDSVKVRIFDEKGSNVGFKSIGSLFFVKKTVREFLVGNKPDIAIMDNYILAAETELESFKLSTKQKLSYNENSLSAVILENLRNGTKNKSGFNAYLNFLNKDRGSDPAYIIKQNDLLEENYALAFAFLSFVDFSSMLIAALIDPETLFSSDLGQVIIPQLYASNDAYDAMANGYLTQRFAHTIKEKLNLGNNHHIFCDRRAFNKTNTDVNDIGIRVIDIKSVTAAVDALDEVIAAVSTLSTSFSNPSSMTRLEKINYLLSDNPALLVTIVENASTEVKLDEFADTDRIYILSMLYLICFKGANVSTTDSLYENTPLYKLITNIPGYAITSEDGTDERQAVEIVPVYATDPEGNYQFLTGDTTEKIVDFLQMQYIVNRPFLNSYYQTQIGLLFENVARASGFNNFLYLMLLKIHKEKIANIEKDNENVNYDALFDIDVENLGINIDATSGMPKAFIDHLYLLFDYQSYSNNLEDLSDIEIADIVFQYDIFSKIQNYRSVNTENKNYYDEEVVSDTNEYENTKKAVYLEINFKDADLQLPEPVFEVTGIDKLDGGKTQTIIDIVANKTAPSTLGRENYFFAGEIDNLAQSYYYNKQESLTPLIFSNFNTPNFLTDYTLPKLKTAVNFNILRSNQFQIMLNLLSTFKNYRDALETITKSDLIQDVKKSSNITGITDIANFDYVSAEQIRLNILNQFYNRPIPQLNYFLQSSFPFFESPAIKEVLSDKPLTEIVENKLICVVGIPYSICRNKKNVTLNFVITDLRTNKIYSNKFDIDLTLFFTNTLSPVRFNGLESSNVSYDDNDVPMRNGLSSKIYVETIKAISGINFNETSFPNNSFKKGIKCVKHFDPKDLEDLEIKTFLKQRYIENNSNNVDKKTITIAKNQLINPGDYIRNTTSSHVFDRIFACALDLNAGDINIDYNDIAITVLIEE